ncbi:Type IIS restriction enzyme M1 protein (plasmid) [Helicobacter suis]|uniref:DNA-methyltransferase n=1 Tax=Helicobacter TaxID=209 RepID=UPI0002E77E0F|nr:MULTISPECIES: site-specific DNA-methyltransferase [Helicobacter]BCD48540.1 Type IIS restriction enzyme M1 protein [Helicobacter suis]GFK17209.1 Type IIS restriction enzyme M1 protein [Helicobacter suis]CRF48574.1 type IIS restriction enzyme M1 protein (mod) [Helicobacter heilmannii]
MLSYNEIHSLDVFEFLNLLPKCSIDLAIVDPPYNLGVAQWDCFGSEQEFLEFSYAWIDALLPKLKPTASFYIFNTAYHCALFLVYLQGKAHFKNWITWHKKDGFANARKKFNNASESILFYTLSEQYIFNCDAIRTPYESTARIQAATKKGILKNNKRWFPNPNGKLCTDVWHISSQRHQEKINGRLVKQKHPTIKPYDLIERIIKASSLPKNVVLDLFAGSGIALEVCQNLDRLYLGTDINHNDFKAHVAG